MSQKTYAGPALHARNRSSHSAQAPCLLGSAPTGCHAASVQSWDLMLPLPSTACWNRGPSTLHSLLSILCARMGPQSPVPSLCSPACQNWAAGALCCSTQPCMLGLRPCTTTVLPHMLGLGPTMPCTPAIACRVTAYQVPHQKLHRANYLTPRTGAGRRARGWAPMFLSIHFYTYYLYFCCKIT